MQVPYYISRFTAWMQRSGQTQLLVVIFFALGLAGMAVEGIRSAVHMCEAYRRPRAAWRETIQGGLAVSLNALERQKGGNRRLPAMNIRGAVFDWRNRDWIIWGDGKLAQPGLPVDTLAVAIRASVAELDSPGVDIRPAVPDQTGRVALQKVTYFGGVESTIVGSWFFQFDHWMKSAALGYAPIPVDGVASYWDRVTNVANIDGLAADGAIRRNQCRFWLKNGEFSGIEDDWVLTFQKTPLQVCAEKLGDESPGESATRQPDDGHSDEDRFAKDLSTWLHKLENVAPILEIEEFAKLLASVAWLAKIDPYRDLSPWRGSPTQPVETTNQVATLHRVASFPLRGRAPRDSQMVYSLELSGGVSICPQMALSGSADGNLRRLGDAILQARPGKDVVTWGFNFQPDINQLKGTER